MLVFLGTMIWMGSPINRNREVLIAFGMLVVVSALVADGVALAAIAVRKSEFGFTANRVAVLGENLLLFVNWAGPAWLRRCWHVRPIFSPAV